MNFDIVISNQTMENHIPLISKYWSIGWENSFIHNLKDLKKEYKLNSKELKIIVERNSFLMMNIERCKLCKSSFDIKIKSRNKLSEVLNSNYDICELCKIYSPQYIDYIPKYEEDIIFEYNNITNKQRFILDGMIKLKSKMLIYRHIFNNDLYNKELWKIINVLENKGLIWVERENDCKIKSFKFPIQIIKLINKDYNI